MSANALEMNGFLLFDGKKGKCRKSERVCPGFSEKRGSESKEFCICPWKLDFIGFEEDIGAVGERNFVYAPGLYEQEKRG